MKGVVSTLAVLAGASLALADFSTGFEAPTYSGSDVGVPLTSGFGGGGQDGWYLPVNGSVDCNVHTYAGNTPGYAANPAGSDQFIAGTSNGGSAFARAQRDHDFTTSDQWVLAYDFAPLWLGAGASAINLSSFSLQDSVVSRSFIGLNNWIDNNDPTLGWKAEFNVYNAAGGAMNNQSPGAEWAALTYNHWYRQSIAVDFALNQITEISITDLTTGVTTTVNPVDWYLQGGSSGGGFALPTGCRFFTGGQLGNSMGWDNLDIVPAGGCDDCDGDGVCDEDEVDCDQDGIPRDCEDECEADLAAPFGMLNVFDFLAYQTLFSNQDPCADLAAPFGVWNVFDFLAYQTAFGNGC